MPDVPYPDTLRTVLVWRLDNGDIAENILHWKVAPGFAFTSDRSQELANFITNSFPNSSLGGLLTTGIELVKVKVYDLRTVPYLYFDWSQSENGTNPAVAMPWQMAICVSLFTDHPGKRGRGRLYLAGFCEDANVAGGLIWDQARTTINDWTEMMIGFNSLDGEDIAWSVLSREDGVSYPIVNGVINNRWDVQRRRANVRLP